MMDVITLGSFDLPHLGHFNLLKRCHQIASGGRVIVGLNTDEFYARYRGEKPVLSYEERKATLLTLPWVSEVYPNHQSKGSAWNFIVSTGAQMIIIGSDWSPWGGKKKDYLSQLGITQHQLDETGISLCFVPYTSEISSTLIKERINDRCCNHARP